MTKFIDGLRKQACAEVGKDAISVREYAEWLEHQVQGLSIEKVKALYEGRRLHAAETSFWRDGACVVQVGDPDKGSEVDLVAELARIDEAEVNGLKAAYELYGLPEVESE